MTELGYREKLDLQGDLAQWLGEQIVDQYDDIEFGPRPGGKSYQKGNWELIGSDEPGFENYDENAILLRRTEDGVTIEVEISTDIYQIEPEDIDEDDDDDEPMASFFNITNAIVLLVQTYEDEEFSKWFLGDAASGNMSLFAGQIDEPMEPESVAVLVCQQLAEKALHMGGENFTREQQTFLLHHRDELFDYVKNARRASSR